MRSRQRVPLAGPGEREHPWHVGEVGDRPIRISRGICCLATSACLDSLANLARSVGRATRRPVCLDRHVAVRCLAVDDPLAADHTRVANVDHAVRGLHVQPNPEAEEEDRKRRQQPDRRHGTRRPRHASPAKPNPRAAPEQVQKRRVHGARARKNVAAHMQLERDTEREQRHEIQVPHREQPPQIGEPEQEHRAERVPDDGFVEDRAAERVAATASHLPCDLRTGADLEHLAGRVHHDPLRNLACATRPHMREPAARLLVELGVGRRVARIPLQPVHDLRDVEQIGDRLLLRQLRAPTRHERRVHQATVFVVDGRRRSRRRRGRCRGDQTADNGEDDRCAADQRPKLHSLLPRKFSGITSAIASACAGSLPNPA